MFFTLISIVQFVPYDGSATGDFPMWTAFVSAFCVFMYQTFDAVDGKQARRTKQSSPLGQLFDHGCDAVNSNLILYLYVQTMQFGTRWNTFAMMLFSMVS